MFIGFKCVERAARCAIVVTLLGSCVAPVAAAAESFVNFESGHVRPLALSPDATLLFAVNTPDNRLSVFHTTTAGLALATDVVVGLEPVAVAARVNAEGKVEAWVVNHLSDSVSIVEVDPVAIERSHVTRTLLVGDEPRDIVLAATAAGDRAFVTTARRGQNLPTGLMPRFTEEGVGRALVWAFDADGPGDGLGGTPLSIIELFCDTPRGLAVSPDGATVYAAAFHSGNQTTTIFQVIVSITLGLPPPPPGFTPDPPETGLIVKRNPMNGRWEDELQRNWSQFVAFSLPDTDVFVIDAAANPPALAAAPNAIAGVGTVLFNLAVRPDNGKVYVGNTDARNHVRFEPLISPTLGVQGHFAENRITVIDGTTATAVHLNPHVDYGVPTGPASEIEQSLALPMDMTFSSDGKTLYVAAFGSEKIGILDTDDLEAGVITAEQIEVGGGPSGVALDEARDRLYVMNRFDHTVSIISDVSDPVQRAQTGIVPLRYDPSPPTAKDGRHFLYDARHTSGHGDAACATCHVFGDFDSLAWDLGNPFGSLVANPNPPTSGSATPATFHPMKGPMTTQSLRGMAGAGAMHWRGDRTAGNDPGGDPADEDGAFKKFNPAFVGLMGRPTELSAAEMQEFTDFILTVAYPPNPVRALDNVPTPAETAGEDIFVNAPIFGGFRCAECHTLPLGTSTLHHLDFKIPHLRNLYQKIGMFGVAVNGFIPPTGFLGDQVRGFGFLHDGNNPNLFTFLQSPLIAFADDTERRAVEDFMLSFDTGLRPVVGQQVSITPSTVNSAVVLQRLDLLVARADAGDCDLVAHAVYGGAPRGLLHLGSGSFQPDRSGEPTMNLAALVALATTPGQHEVFTCVPPGSGARVALDRDEDGFFDRDELDAGSDPANPTSVPGTGNCSPAPSTACRATGKSSIKLSTQPGRERLVWKWSKGAETELGELGDPVDGSTAYTLCVYNGPTDDLAAELVVPPERTCNGIPCWRATSSGLKYRDSAQSADGVEHLQMRAQASGRARVILKGKGSNLPLPVLPPQGLALPLTVQLHNSTGVCWSAAYDTADRNDGTDLKASF